MNDGVECKQQSNSNVLNFDTTVTASSVQNLAPHFHGPVTVVQ